MTWFWKGHIVNLNDNLGAKRPPHPGAQIIGVEWVTKRARWDTILPRYA